MINVKKINEFAKLPEKANQDDAGFDLFSVERVMIPALERRVVKTGIALEIENIGSEMFKVYLRIAPRSGLAVKKGLDVFAGVVDFGYRGEILVCLFNSSNQDVEINVGDKIAQMIPTLYLDTKIRLVSELTLTQRGEKGFGSSGV